MKRFLLVLAVAATGLAGIPTDAHARCRRGGTEVRIAFGQDRPWFGEIRYSERDRWGSPRNRCDSRDGCRSDGDRRDDRYSSWRNDRRSCDHRRAESITRQVWVPATYRTVVVGLSRCGEPRTDRVRVPGHWDTVVTGHHCGTCGASW